MSRASLPQSFKFAACGIAAAFRGGRNFKVQLAFAVIAVALGLWLGIGPGEWAAICICIGMVLGGECVNTALEAVVDLASPERHELAKRAKDCAAGGVLACSAASLAVGIIIFAPRLLELLAALAFIAGAGRTY